MPVLAPFEAFSRDATVLRVEEDETRLPVVWLAAAQVAARLADSRIAERQNLIRTWASQVAAGGDASELWAAMSAPGIVVRDFLSACETLIAMSASAKSGGALNLAYSITTHVRIALLDRGSASVRGRATYQQAEILEMMGLFDEAGMTFSEAREDALRGQDSDTERKAVSAELRLGKLTS